MPLYEYECDACNDRFEVLQKVDSSPVRRCQKCGGKVRRLISAPSFRFRGSGWYVTDYGKGNHPPGQKGEEKKASKKDESAAKSPVTGEKSGGEKPAKK